MEWLKKHQYTVVSGLLGAFLAFLILFLGFFKTIFVLIFTGYMTVVPCFTIIGAYAIGQVVFIVRLWYLHKTM